MRILIATAGALPPTAVASLVQQLWATGASVAVMTTIEVPRSFLEELQTEEWRPFDDSEMSPESERAVAAYLAERGMRRVEPILAALDAAQFHATPLFVEADDPVVGILETISEQEADLLIMGATRPIFDEDVWQSVAVKVMQQSPIPVVMVPGVGRSEGAEEQDAESRS